MGICQEAGIPRPRGLRRKQEDVGKSSYAGASQSTYLTTYLFEPGGSPQVSKRAKYLGLTNDSLAAKMCALNPVCVAVGVAQAGFSIYGVL